MPIENASEQPFSQVARPANKLMDQMQKGFYVYSGETWTPNVNLYETAASYFVCVDLAGVDKQKIDLEVVDQRLKLRGTRAVPSYDDANPEHAGGAPEAGGPPEAGAPPGAAEAESAPRRVRIHLMEIDHGAFSREVELPLDVDKERITANYRSGMLWVEIPKS
jgi:HSP20 family molecular chaperone IbpA